MGVRPWPKPIKTPDGQSHSSSRTLYYMGLRKRSTQMTATTLSRASNSSVNLNGPVNEFRHLVMSWDDWQEGMDVVVRHLKQKDLPEFVFSEGENPSVSCSLFHGWPLTALVIIVHIASFHRVHHACWLLTDIPVSYATPKASKGVVLYAVLAAVGADLQCVECSQAALRKHVMVPAAPPELHTASLLTSILLCCQGRAKALGVMLFCIVCCPCITRTCGA